MFSIEGKVIIITGAGTGIGRVLAERMAEHNAIVCCIDISFPVRAPAQLADNMFERVCDISDHSAFRSICDEIFRVHGRIDVLVNNAGVTYTKPSDQCYPVEQWNISLNINLTAAFTCSQSVSEYMIRQRRGSIINITSLGAKLGFPNNPAYVASKGGLKMLGKALARDWGQYGIRVNNVGPGYIRTSMTEKSYRNKNIRRVREARIMLGRWGTPEDLVGPCIFLASDASAYVTAQDIYVDGGWSANGLNDEVSV